MGVDIKTRERELECVSFVMSDKRGREFLWRMLGVCGLYKSTMLTCPKGVLPSERSIYNGAQQDVAQMIHTEIYAADPTGQSYKIMASESHVKAVLDAEEAKKKNKKENADGGNDDGTRDDGTESNPT